MSRKDQEARELVMAVLIAARIAKAIKPLEEAISGFNRTDPDLVKWFRIEPAFAGGVAQGFRIVLTKRLIYLFADVKRSECYSGRWKHSGLIQRSLYRWVVLGLPDHQESYPTRAVWILAARAKTAISYWVAGQGMLNGWRAGCCWYRIFKGKVRS